MSLGDRFKIIGVYGDEWTRSTLDVGLAGPLGPPAPGGHGDDGDGEEEVDWLGDAPSPKLQSRPTSKGQGTGGRMAEPMPIERAVVLDFSGDAGGVEAMDRALAELADMVFDGETESEADGDDGPPLPPPELPPPAPLLGATLMERRARCADDIDRFRPVHDLQADLRFDITVSGWVQFSDTEECVGRVVATFGGRTLCATCRKHGSKCKVLLQMEGRYEQTMGAMSRWLIAGHFCEAEQHHRLALSLRQHFRVRR